MEPTIELIRDIDRRRVLRAREMTEEQRFLATAELFDTAARICTAGIREQHPGISDADALVELKRRLALMRKLELHAIH